MSFDDANVQLNVELAKKLSESSKPVVVKKDNSIIIGETHIKTLSDETVEQQFSQDLRNSNIIVVEHNSNSGNSYSQQSTEKRFMQQAQEHAIESSKPLVVLDNEIQDRYKLWLDNDIDVSREDFALLIGMHSLLSDFQNQVPTGESLKRLTDLYAKYFAGQEQYAHQLATAAQTCLFSPGELEKIDEKFSLMVDFIQIDSLVREQYYQKRVMQISRAYPDQSLIVVVGKDHALPILRTLTDGQLSSIEPSLSARISASLSAVKDRISFANIVK